MSAWGGVFCKVLKVLKVPKVLEVELQGMK